MLWTLVIILLVLALVGGLPHWGHMSGYNYGYFPSGIIGLLVVVLLVLALTGRL